MVFRTPPISAALKRQLDELDRLRSELGDRTSHGAPWLGRLRRQVRGTSVESSVSIEGFTVSADQAAALVAGEQTPAVDSADQLAVEAYARAMDHVGTMARDPHFRWSERVILDLHFDACLFQRDRSPGLWRTGPIQVTGTRGREPAFVGPDAKDVPKLMGEVVDWLERGDRSTHVAVRAAMAHLHVVSVHPFSDGNGRVARIVQSLVLALDGRLTPEFNSIEEYLGSHTREYYEVLHRVQGGRYQPERDATPWVRFCIAAHVEQAQQRLALLAESSRRWAALEALAAERQWPDRLVIAMEQSLFEGVDRQRYAGEAGVSAQTASADLRRLVDAGLVIQQGQTRNMRYVASEALRGSIGA